MEQIDPYSPVITMEKIIISSCVLTLSLSLLMHYMNTQMGVLIRNWIGTEVIYQAASMEDNSLFIPNLFLGTITVLLFWRSVSITFFS